MCPLARGIEFYPFLFIALLTTIVNPLYLYFQTYLQTIQDAKRYAINMLTNFGINVSLILILLIIFNKGVLGILYANLITAILFFLYSIKYCERGFEIFTSFITSYDFFMGYGYGG